jgi:outer membrane protein assembly factor BamB
VPIPARGTVVLVQANAVDNNNIADTAPDKSGGSPGRINFTVSASSTAPTVQTSAFRIAPGASVTVTGGGGYQAGESVALTLPTATTTTLATVTATSTGAIPSTVVTIPAKGVPFGPISLIATGNTSARQGSTPIYISNNWDQWRNTTAKTGFEPNDVALDGSVGANGKSFMDQAYSYPSGGAIHSSPSIDQGVAFFGNDAGIFTALKVTNSAPKWTKTFSAGIDSSAAVDGGLVIVGVQNSSVVAMNETTGAIVWTTSTGGPVESSPLVTGGVVYVGADDHKVYALNETTGAVLWTATLGGAVRSSPTFVSSQSLVVVGDDTGNVTALATANGAVKWHSLTGGAVTATPMVFSNNIYVGSADGKEYAFVAKTGVQKWTFTTGGAIVASNVTFGTNIGVGSGDGTVYYLSSSTGALVNSLAGTVPIVGISGSVNFVVAATSKGTAFASRVNGADQTWKYNGDGVGFASSPTELNGTVYITGLDMGLHAFTAPGASVL